MEQKTGLRPEDEQHQLLMYMHEPQGLCIIHGRSKAKNRDPKEGLQSTEEAWSPREPPKSFCCTGFALWPPELSEWAVSLMGID